MRIEKPHSTPHTGGGWYCNTTNSSSYLSSSSSSSSSWKRLCVTVGGCLAVAGIIAWQSSFVGTNTTDLYHSTTSSSRSSSSSGGPLTQSGTKTVSSQRTKSSSSKASWSSEPLPTRVRFVWNATQRSDSSSTHHDDDDKGGGGSTPSKSSQTKLKTKSAPLCRRWQIRMGQWLPAVATPGDGLSLKLPYKTTVQHLRCYPDEEYQPDRPWTHTYKWIPDAAFVKECVFAEYQPRDLCALLPKATISIIGDSLSWEHYRSLVSLHHVSTHQGYQQQSYELGTNIQQAICPDGETTVVYRRDDYLANVPASLQQNFPQVLILNRGAHYVPDDQLRTEIRTLIPQIQAWLTVCNDKFQIECHFFWRTSVPGHIGCNETKSSPTTTTGGWNKDTKQTTKVATNKNVGVTARSVPNNNLAEMEAWVENPKHYNSVSMEYHWHDVRRQNELVLKEFKKADLSNFQVLDAYHLNILRPDEHRVHQNGDCLHSCFPGKMDVYNQLLLHFLKMQRSANDVKRLVKLATKRQWAVHVPATVYDPQATQEARDKRLAALKLEASENSSNDNDTDDREQASDDEEEEESNE